MTKYWKNWAFRAALLSAAALAACQTPTTSYPTRIEGAPYSPDTIVLPPEQQPPASAPSSSFGAPPSGAVESQSLPPLGSNIGQPLPPPPPQPQPSAPPAPVFRDAVTGPVVDADGPPSVRVVQAGDTLSSIARDLGTTVARLSEQNNISDPSLIRPGQRIEGPATRGKAYVVQSGDTLSAIGRRFNVTAAQLAAANSINVNDIIRPNQRIMLPAGYRDTGPYQVQVAGTAAPAAPSAPAPAPAPRPTTSAPPPPPPPPPPAAAASSSQIVALGRGRFVWPVDGPITGTFGARGTNQQADGIDIAAPEGTPVAASAAGTVTYAGELNDFGNLVLIDHGNGFYTAYAHLASINVRMQDSVNQGAVIGRVGRTGDVPEPKLYFEMRFLGGESIARPIDPMPILPAR